MVIKSNKASLIFLLLPLTILVVLRINGFDGMAGQDGYAYVDYAIAIKRWLTFGESPGHFFWPPGYSLLGACLGLFIYSVPLSMQLISCLSLSLLLITINALLKKLYPTSNQKGLVIYLVLFGMFVPYFFRQGMVTTSDMLACFMVTLSIFFGYQYIIEHKFKYMVFVFIAVSFGTLVRFPTIIVLTPWLLYLVLKWFASARKFSHLLILCIPLSCVYLYSLFNEDITLFLHHPSVVNWEFANYWKTTFITGEGTIKHLIPNFLFVFSPIAHPGYLFPGLILIYICIKEKALVGLHWAAWVLGYLCYAFFLAGYLNQNYRHLLIVYPIVLLIGFYGYNRIYTHWFFIKHQVRLLPILFLAQLSLCWLALKPTLHRNLIERLMTLDLKDYAKVSHPDTLYSFDIDIALKSRGIPYTILSLYVRTYDNFNRGAFILFNEAKLSKQWKGLAPMTNWEHLKKNYKLKKIKDFPDGWTLFKIE